jgi:hypothetical protein
MIVFQSGKNTENVCPELVINQLLYCDTKTNPIITNYTIIPLVKHKLRIVCCKSLLLKYS